MIQFVLTQIGWFAGIAICCLSAFKVFDWANLVSAIFLGVVCFSGLIWLFLIACMIYSDYHKEAKFHVKVWIIALAAFFEKYRSVLVTRFYLLLCLGFLFFAKLRLLEGAAAILIAICFAAVQAGYQMMRDDLTGFPGGTDEG